MTCTVRLTRPLNMDEYGFQIKSAESIDTWYCNKKVSRYAAK